MEREKSSPGRRLIVKDSDCSGESSSMIGMRIEASLAPAGNLNTPTPPVKSIPSNHSIKYREVVNHKHAH